MTERSKLNGILVRISVSLIIAILIWYSVNGNSNNIISRNILNVPVVLVNENQLKEKGLVIDENINYYVNLEIRGTESSLEAINTNEITAEINLGDITGEGSQNLPVVISGLNNTVILDQTTPSEIQINVSEIKDSEFTPEILTQGKPKEGFSVISSKTNQTIKVNGPSSDIDMIDSISGVANVNGLSENSYQYVEVHAYNSDGEILENIECTPNTVSCEIILGVTKLVSVDIPEITFNSDKYKIGEININPQEVTIAGDQQTIEAITSVTTQPIDISSNTQLTVSETTKLVLPNNTIIIGGNDDVKVHIELQQILDRSFTVSDFNIIGLGENLGIQSINPNSVIAKISGTTSELNNLSSNIIKANLDLSGLNAGVYEIPVTLNIDQLRIENITPQKVTVELQELHK